MDNRPVVPYRTHTSWTGVRSPDFSGLYDRPIVQGPIQQHVLRCPVCRAEEPCDRLLELVAQAKRFGDTVSMSYFNEVPASTTVIPSTKRRRLFGVKCRWFSVDLSIGHKNRGAQD